MLLKVIADLAQVYVENSGKDIRQAVKNAVNSIQIKRNMTQEEIINKVKEECEE